MYSLVQSMKGKTLYQIQKVLTWSDPDLLGTTILENAESMPLCEKASYDKFANNESLSVLATFPSKSQSLNNRYIA